MPGPVFLTDANSAPIAGTNPLPTKVYDASGVAVVYGPVYNTTRPTYSNGDTGVTQIDARGNTATALYSAGNVNPITSVGVSADARLNSSLNPLDVVGYGYQFNGTSWDRVRNNIDTAALITLSASGAATTNSADQVNYNGRGVLVVIDVTLATAMTLTVNIQAKDAASGKYVTIASSAALVATGTTTLQLYPGAVTTANVSVSGVLPRTWRIQTVSTGTSVSATVGASVIV